MFALNEIKAKIEALFEASNAFDVATTLTFFHEDAEINDLSVGTPFTGRIGVQDYLERFFVGYNTHTQVISVVPLAKDAVRMRVDFTGDFGHEIGRLDTTFCADGLITYIEAELE